MCADVVVKNNLATAMAVLLVGGGCLGWVGNKAVEYTFSDVRQNTEFRISKEVQDAHVREEIGELKFLLTSNKDTLTVNRESLIQIKEQLKRWEPNGNE